MFPLEITNMVIAQMGGSGTPGTLPWLHPCRGVKGDVVALLFSLPAPHSQVFFPVY